MATTTSTTGKVWYGWVASGSCAITATTSSDIWGTWTQGATATTTSVVTSWGQWVTVSYSDQAKRILTEAQIEHERERQEAYRLRREQDQEERKLAAQRAMMLLLACLSAKQKEEFEEKKHFHVTAKSGRRYQIREGISHNLKMIDETGKVIKSLCVHPQGVPVGDVMLAQKFAIETDEEAMLKVANIQNAA